MKNKYLTLKRSWTTEHFKFVKCQRLNVQLEILGRLKKTKKQTFPHSGNYSFVGEGSTQGLLEIYISFLKTFLPWRNSVSDRDMENTHKPVKLETSHEKCPECTTYIYACESHEKCWNV